MNDNLLKYALLQILKENDGDWLLLQDTIFDTLQAMQESLFKFVKEETQSHLRLVKNL
jgi:hypothetical protein